MEDAKKKKKRENKKSGGGSAAGHGARAGRGPQPWVGMDGDGYPGGMGSSHLSSPLPRFSPVQKEGKKKEKKNTQ